MKWVALETECQQFAVYSNSIAFSWTTLLHSKFVQLNLETIIILLQIYELYFGRWPNVVRHWSACHIEKNLLENLAWNNYSRTSKLFKNRCITQTHLKYKCGEKMATCKRKKIHREMYNSDQFFNLPLLIKVMVLRRMFTCLNGPFKA